MPRKPFTVSIPSPPEAHKPPPVIDRTAARDKADDEGITLFEAGAEVMTPDGEAGPLDEGSQETGGRPVYAPNIPWPDAKLAHKPYKI
jgi:hypothetical protein